MEHFKKLRNSDNTPSWQPKHWQKVCPYPLCPSYRQFARLLSIILIGKSRSAWLNTKYPNIADRNTHKLSKICYYHSEVFCWKPLLSSRSYDLGFGYSSASLLLNGIDCCWFLRHMKITNFSQLCFYLISSRYPFHFFLWLDPFSSIAFDMRRMNLLFYS